MKFVLLISLMSFSDLAHSNEHATLNLKGRALSTIRTNLKQGINRGKFQQWLLDITSNQAYHFESHKIEIVGLNQPGLQSNIRKLASENKKIKHELLISYIAENAKVVRPIFVNISAN